MPSKQLQIQRQFFGFTSSDTWCDADAAAEWRDERRKSAQLTGRVKANFTSHGQSIYLIPKIISFHSNVYTLFFASPPVFRINMGSADGSGVASWVEVSNISESLAKTDNHVTGQREGFAVQLMSCSGIYRNCFQCSLKSYRSHSFIDFYSSSAIPPTHQLFVFAILRPVQGMFIRH